MRNRIIQYGIDRDTGLVVSRVGNEVAWPALEWDAVTHENCFATAYPLIKVNVLDVAATGRWNSVRWTRKVPTAVKNEHRRFWGFKVLAA